MSEQRVEESAAEPGPGADLVDRVLAALRVARSAHALLPPLPAGMRGAHVQVLGALDRLGGGARVSDLGAALGLALPNATRLVNELVALGVVEKVPAAEDRRVVRVRATRRGERYRDEYVRRFHRRAARELSRLPAVRLEAMIETLGQVHGALARASRVAPGRPEAPPARHPGRRRGPSAGGGR